MAKVTVAAGLSHTPLLTFSADLWSDYATRDLNSQRLNTSDGAYVSYGQLLQMSKGRFAGLATLDRFRQAEAACQHALDRIATDIAAAAPDVVIVVTDDESELFSRTNTPAVSIYYGSTIVMRPFASRMVEREDTPLYFAAMTRGYSMDQPREFPADGEFARELIERLIQHDIDIGAAAQVEDPSKAGLGHGVGFVIDRVLGGRRVPIIPVLINTYYPPNAPTPSRCVDIGRALRQAIDETQRPLNVALVASGGLSHFVVDEDLDRRVIDAVRLGRPDDLRTIPMGSLNAGSSEIRNWIAVAGAIEDMRCEWLEYQPMYRTPAGTGVGAAFAVWR
jgi:hypothetical protein